MHNPVAGTPECTAPIGYDTSICIIYVLGGINDMALDVALLSDSSVASWMSPKRHHRSGYMLSARVCIVQAYLEGVNATDGRGVGHATTSLTVQALSSLTARVYL